MSTPDIVGVLISAISAAERFSRGKRLVTAIHLSPKGLAVYDRQTEGGRFAEATVERTKHGGVVRQLLGSDVLLAPSLVGKNARLVLEDREVGITVPLRRTR